METVDIRHKLHKFIDTIEDKKAVAIYTLFEDEIEQDEWEYTDEFKSKLDIRYDQYKGGAEMISEKDAEEQINLIMKS